MKHQPSPEPVVIIGGGVAGLTAATLLAAKGFGVSIFEARNDLGGCCATTTVDGYTFNDGAVYLTVIDVLDHAFAKLGLNRAELLPLRKISKSSFATLPDGTTVTLEQGPRLTVAERSTDARRLQSELDRMIDKWQPVLRFVSGELALHPFSYWRLLRKGGRHLHKLRGTVASEFNSLFSDQAVRAALSGALLYYGLPAQELPASAILGLIAEMCDGLYLPEGGMGRVPQVLTAALQTRGGRVFRGSSVDKIIISDGRVRGVDVKGRGRVDAAAVVSTASGMQTFRSLIPSDHVPAAIGRRLRHTRLSHKAVSIQFGLANSIAAPAHSVNVLPWMEDQQDIFLQDGRDLKYPVYLVPTFTMPELAPRGGSIVEMFYPVRADIPLEYWNEKRRTALAEAAIAALQETYYLDIAVTRVRSPKDFLEQMHLFEGALYGLSPAARPSEQFSHTPSVSGLYLAGQTTFPGYGVGSSMMSGIFAAEALVHAQARTR
ncbi:MAG TPA: NAD(P)/FAD-dependent oxidoreductase [Actinomycetes bacterium]|jgi:phytoene desaturase|nr:NAD(P)/FAD-dependent oxidoreductase [Actinomycetes bacterium]